MKSSKMMRSLYKIMKVVCFLDEQIKKHYTQNIFEKSQVYRFTGCKMINMFYNLHNTVMYENSFSNRAIS